MIERLGETILELWFQPNEIEKEDLKNRLEWKGKDSSTNSPTNHSDNLSGISTFDD